jgi:hypothetical protein
MEPEVTVKLAMADREISVELLNAHDAFVKIHDTGPKRDGQPQLAQFDCRPIQAAAILFLALAGDDGPGELITDLYKIAEPLCADLPINLRPIP